MKKTGLLVVLFLLAFVAVLIYSTIGLKRFRVEVCIDFRGRTSCRISAASTREQALRTATENACALLASGMTDSMACSATPPRSVKWLAEN